MNIAHSALCWRSFPKYSICFFLNCIGLSPNEYTLLVLFLYFLRVGMVYPRRFHFNVLVHIKRLYPCPIQWKTASTKIMTYSFLMRNSKPNRRFLQDQKEKNTSSCSLIGCVHIYFFLLSYLYASTYLTVRWQLISKRPER